MSTEFRDKDFKNKELSKCPVTGAGTTAKFSAGRGQSNRDFWPNSLNLKILSQHSNLIKVILIPIRRITTISMMRPKKI